MSQMAPRTTALHLLVPLEPSLLSAYLFLVTISHSDAAAAPYSAVAAGAGAGADTAAYHTTRHGECAIGRQIVGIVVSLGNLGYSAV